MGHLIAIDGGGSTCRVLAAAVDGTVLGRADGGSANINSDFEGAFANIIETAARAIGTAGIEASVISGATAVLGLAGANVGDNARRLAARLPFARSVVRSDAVIATRGALGREDGVMAILGTGSVFTAQAQGEIRMIGGWGFAVGDLGSGARIGQALLERTLLGQDGIRPQSELTRHLMENFEGIPGNITTFATSARPRDFAIFAPLVFDEAWRDDVAAVEVRSAAIRDVEEALAALMPAGSHRVCLMGGLAELYAPHLRDTTRAALQPPKGDALSGALDMAREEWVQEHGVVDRPEVRP